jgi:hypothetical protein
VDPEKKFGFAAPWSRSWSPKKYFRLRNTVGKCGFVGFKRIQLRILSKSKRNQKLYTCNTSTITITLLYPTVQGLGSYFTFF